MSLDWSLEKVEDWDSNCYIKVGLGDNAYNQIEVRGSNHWFFEKDEMKKATSVKKCMNPITDTLISHTMSFDLGSIKESNIEEWQFRIWVTEQLQGSPILVSRWNAEQGICEDSQITVSDLRNHIGLFTNVADKTRNQWITKVFKRDYMYRRHFKNRWIEEEEKC
jgi:hypothetical protein